MMRQPLDPAAIEARTQAIGRELFQLARREHAHLTSLNRWTRQVLSWCVSDRQVKARVLRFIDCLPSLQTPDAVIRHVREYFPTDQLRLPVPLRVGASLARPGLLAAPAVAFAVRQLVEQVAQQFIAGEQPEEATRLIARMAAQGLLVSFDVLGEQVTNEQEADEYARRYAALLHAIGEGAGALNPPALQLCSRPVLHLSIKPSSLSPRFDPLRFDESVEQVLSRLVPLARLAAELGAAITLDMEQYERRDLTVELAKRLLAEPGLGERLALGIVIQAYLQDSADVVQELVEWLTHHTRRVSIRLVKGAYWDYEVAISRQRGWPSPVYLEKWQTDQAFEALAEQLLSHATVVQTEIASHNLRSIARAMAVAEIRATPPTQMEFQLLYGMGEVIQAAIRQAGYPVRIYTPVGALIPGMAYLVRRLLENTANESFLKQDWWDEVTSEELLKPPAPHTASDPAGCEPSVPVTGMS